MSTDLAASQTLTIQGVTVPAFLYGTAWKEERTPGLVASARRLSATPAQVLFRFALSQGILPITGTSDPRHMAADLAARQLTLSGADIAAVGAVEA